MPGVSRRKALAATLFGSLAAVGSIALGSIDYGLEVTKLEVGLGGRVAFLPDVHYHFRGEAHVDGALKALERLDPDAVVIAGDLVDEETKDMEGLDSVLRRTEARVKLAVLGNHEYWSGRASETANALRRWGFEVLVDRFAETPFGRVFGYDWREDRRYARVVTDGLVLAHDPNVADSVSGGAFVLAGHTHGGLVVGGLTLLTNSRYNRGLYELRGARLYVSRGIGQMFHQVRVNSRPELLIVD
ncbi:MAG: metallophosphoesterase [Aigarchaeota archaeon]|nr:metallophosphoesterase [Aigarchaeota archaeon]MCS7126950.1 metallophosphoesterase [Candidatus Calditenuaceae archaeon]MDW8043072.1 metallophosphoesterase [Nitrososphaerota archaeon]